MDQPTMTIGFAQKYVPMATIFKLEISLGIKLKFKVKKLKMSGIVGSVVMMTRSADPLNGVNQKKSVSC